MTRPGLVLEVDDRTPPLVVHEGEGFRLEEFPRGTRVVYPPEQPPGVGDVDGVVRTALASPHGSEPLAALLRPGMRLTISFDDVSRPLPATAGADVRQRVVEQVLTLAAEAGVDDVELVCGIGLRRRLRSAEMRAVLGERVFRSFAPQGRLRNHDAEDGSCLVRLGETEAGEEVELDRRAAESDLLVHVGVITSPAEVAPASVPLGLGSSRLLRRLHGHLPHAGGLHDPHGPHDPDVPGGPGPVPGDGVVAAAARRAGRVVEDAVRVFHVEVVLGGQQVPRSLSFLTTREWEWSLADQLSMLAARRVVTGPRALRHRAVRRLRAPHGVVGVTAGAAGPVGERTAALLARQQVVEVPGQSDVVVVGVSALGPHGPGPVSNPVLAAAAGLSAAVGSANGTPLVRRGGAVVVHHPATPSFSPLHHPSYLDFYDEVLPETTDAAVIAERFEDHYATDPWYVHLYRTSHAVHGVSPVLQWYRVARALQHVGEVVWVGGDRGAVERMGFRAASTMADALEVVRDAVGPSPSLAYLHDPPRVTPDVR